MSTLAQVKFRYPEGPIEEAVRDLDMLDAKLRLQALIHRGAKCWRVVKIEVQRPTSKPTDLPVWLVYLEHCTEG